jgi:hypothetical protein
VASVAAPALENAAAGAPSTIRQGVGRKKLRTDIAGAGSTGLGVPGA